MQNRFVSPHYILPLAVLTLCMVLQYGWCTYFTGDIFGTELRSVAYDSLGKSLLKGAADIEPETINWEGLDIGGKKYMYQGPLPALLRIPLNLVLPDRYGQWGRASCLLAAALCAAAIWGVCLLGIGKNEALRLSRHRPLLAAILTFGVTLGSPITYLMSCARIYHEAILWGLAGGLWAVLCFIRFFEAPANRRTAALIPLGVAAGIALLSRVTFGAAALVLWGFATVSLLWTILTRTTPSPLRSLGRTILATTPAVAMIALQLWYNWARFGDIRSFINYKFFYLDPSQFGGEWNLKRVPDALYNYFGLRTEHFIAEPPYFSVSTAVYQRPELFFEWREQTSSLLLASPWILLASLLALVHLLRHRKSSTLVLLGFTPLLAQTIGIMSYNFVSARYAAEFLPLAVYLLFFALQTRSITRRWQTAILGATLLWSVLASSLAAASWHIFYAAPGTDTTREINQRFKDLFHSSWSQSSSTARKVFVTAAMISDEHYGFTPPQINKRWDGAELTIRGQPVTSGIGTHAPTSFSLVAPPGVTSFELLFTLADSAFSCPSASGQLRIVDSSGKVLATSKVMGVPGAALEGGKTVSRLEAPQWLSVPVVASEKITIEVDPLGSRDCDHFTLAFPAFLAEQTQ